MPERKELLVRRVISLRNVEPGLSVGWLEDNFHHFGISLRHREGVVSEVAMRAVRFPWTTCAQADLRLRDLIGLPLQKRASDLAQQLPMQLHCTHMFELAALVMVQAASGLPGRKLDFRVWRDGDGLAGGLAESEAANTPGVTVFCKVRDATFLSPPVLAGQSLVRGFRDLLAAQQDDAEAERLWLLRRAFWLAEGDTEFMRKDFASEVGLGPVCHTFQPERSCQAKAIAGSRIDVNSPGRTFLDLEMEIP